MLTNGRGYMFSAGLALGGAIDAFSQWPIWVPVAFAVTGIFLASVIWYGETS